MAVQLIESTVISILESKSTLLQRTTNETKLHKALWNNNFFDRLQSRDSFEYPPFTYHRGDFPEI